MTVNLAAKGVSEDILKKLFNASKASCVVYQTLKPALEIDSKLQTA